MSRDGLHWLPGAGSYGRGWGNVGNGITVEAGGTFYIKYYSDTDGLTLSFATHGAPWGSWFATGPALTRDIGVGERRPVILKLSKVGTPQSTASWVNGSGAWSGITKAGVYDLGLDSGAMWTRPPLTIVEPPPAAFSWRSFFGLSPTETSALAGPPAVPDSGTTGKMLLATVVALGLLGWLVRRRRRRRGAGVQQSPG